MRSTHASIRYPNKEGKPFDEMDELDWKRDFNLGDKMLPKNVELKSNGQKLTFKGCFGLPLSRWGSPLYEMSDALNVQCLLNTRQKI